jgi:HTH-type transcriptional regulator/antitoxin HigA
MTSAVRGQRLDFSEPHVLRNEAEYDAAVGEVDELLERDPPVGSPEYERLRFLAVLIGAYDDDHYPMGDTSTPQSVVAFMLEQKGMTRADLAPILGGRSRVSEFFSGKRRLSVHQMRRIRDVLGVPADLLLDRPRPARRKSRRGARKAQEAREANLKAGATRGRGRRKV